MFELPAAQPHTDAFTSALSGISPSNADPLARLEVNLSNSRPAQVVPCRRFLLGMCNVCLCGTIKIRVATGPDDSPASFRFRRALGLSAVGSVPGRRATAIDPRYSWKDDRSSIKTGS